MKVTMPYNFINDICQHNWEGKAASMIHVEIDNMQFFFFRLKQPLRDNEAFLYLTQ